MNPLAACRVWVTRAEPGASRTAAALAARGFRVVVDPLLEIRRLAQTPPDLSEVQALAFTSRNGVEAFADLCPDRGLPVFTVGDATARAARAAGFADVRSADGTLAELASLLYRAGAPGQVLAPGALDPAGDLAEMLNGGVAVRPLPVYEAVETGVQAPLDFDAVLIHSPRAARALGRALGPDGGRGRLAVAISQAAAAALPFGEFSAVAVAARPTDDGVLEALGKVAPAV